MGELTEGNKVYYNEGRGVLTGFNFMLRVEAAFDMPLKSVRAFTRELEFDYIQEGGLNDYVHMRRKGITKPFTFEFDRYVGMNYIDTLPLGANMLLPLVLMVSRIPGQFYPFVVARTYNFTGCTIIKKTYGELDAMKSELLVETVTVAYRELVVVDIPWSEAAGEDIAGPTNEPNSATDKEEAELRARCDAVVEAADKLKADKKDEMDKYGAELKAVTDADKKVEEEEAQLEKDKKPPKESPADKAARLARKPKLEEANKIYKETKKSVDVARQAGFSARSFTIETDLRELTENAEKLLAQAQQKNGTPLPPIPH
ncbi:MAG: hypothetical protein RR573_07015 [Oscillospiraceae bacterium]